jgi:hypothetical protein
MSKILGLFVVAFCLALGVGQQASAQPAGAIAFAPDATLTVGVVTFELTRWTCNEGGTRSNPTPCANTLYLAPGPGPNPSVVIEAAIGNTSSLSSIEYFACTGGGTCSNGYYDLSVDLTVSTPAGKAELDGASASVTGSASPSSYDPDVGGTEVVGGGCAGGLAANLTGGGSCTFSLTHTLNLSKDFGLTLTAVPSGVTMELDTITEGFTLAPEPASMASLLAGVIALAAVRGKRRRV